MPMSSPALKLSVAKVMSAASAGSGGVSRAMTNRPASFAFFSASTTEGPLGVIRMPLSPLEIAFSMAWIWVSSSPSALPAASLRSTPSASAAFFAPSCMETKNGLEVVLTISETPIFSSAPPLDEGVEPPPQAVRLSAPRVRTAPAARIRVRVDRVTLELNIETPDFVAVGGAFLRLTTLSGNM
ncbi:exported hypothetical protein [Arthrobacter sp. 9V]|nr:exported hypothetical protein [Arthrobacter sp. 9V]